MGAAESTGRPNGTIEREEEGGSFTEKVATAAGAAVIVWGISRTLAAGAAVIAWGISRILSDNTDSQAIKSPTPKRENQPSIRAPPPPPDRFKISTKGESSGYGGIISHNDGDYLHFSSDVVQKYSVWRPPPRGRFKMNTAAVSGPIPRWSAYAGILRNDRGEWVRGFMGIGPADTQTAQICAILKGMLILDLLDLKNSILESDCCEVVLRIKEKNKSYQQTNPIITRCSRLAFKNNITVDNVHGDHANRCAEKLAVIALSLREKNYLGIKECPLGIKHLIDKDKEFYKSYGVVEKSLPITYEGRVKRRSFWSPPDLGRYKMNTDGACKPNPGPSGGYGGILRNNHGDFVYGFYGFIDRKTDGLTAEFHGIHKGFKLLNKLGYMGSILETDCQAAFEWVTERKKGPSKSKIISDCRDIIEECIELRRINKIEVEKIVGKHANKCADKLAAMALKEEEEYMEFEYVPREIKSFVDKDKSIIKCS